jgi:hypothetical protein
LFLFACSSNNKKNTNSTTSNSELYNLNEYTKDINQYSNSINDISLLFQSADAPFIDNITNDTKNFNKYTDTEELSAINMGVYWVDALYLYSYNKKEKSLESLNAAVNIAKTLNIDESFSKLATDKYNGNTNIDSFFIKLDECFMNAEYLLSEHKRMRIYTSMLMGKYIQTQYILFNIIFNYPTVDDDVKYTMLQDLLRVISRNIESTDELLRLIEKYKNSDDKDILRTDIEAFAKNYQLIKKKIENKEITPETLFESNVLEIMYKQITDMHNYITEIK